MVWVYFVRLSTQTTAAQRRLVHDAFLRFLGTTALF